MTIPATWEPLTDVDPVLTIAQDLFATMIDGEPGHLYPWLGENPALDEARYTWVDVAGPIVTRVMLMTGRETGEKLTRSLLMMGEDEAVSDMDFADAVGELANVVGGNVKSLVTNPGALTLPVVTHEFPAMPNGAKLLETYFGWNGAPLGVSLWALT
jgi:CheY-specific phosphatase CheX